MPASLKLHRCFILVLAVLVIIAFASQPAFAQPVGTIQDLINAAPSGGTVIIPAGTFHETLSIDKDLILRGAGREVTILSPGAPNERVIKVANGHSLVLEDLQITNGSVPADVGGGVLVDGGTLIVRRCRIEDNSAAYGGGIFKAGETGGVYLDNSLLLSNQATMDGGGVYSEGFVDVKTSTVSSNAASRHGGGIHAGGPTATIESSTISGNHAGENGGGINLNGSAGVIDSTFDGNDAGTSGGGLLKWGPDGSVIINGSTFSNNRAVINGGGVYSGANITLQNSNFLANTADSGNTRISAGGGLYAANGLLATAVTFTNNKTACSGCGSNDGGGMYITSTVPSPSIVTFSTFDGNNGWSGGGLFSSNSVQLTVMYSTFKNNGQNCTSCTGYGGGITAYNLTGDRLNFDNNRAMNSGGGVYGHTITLSSTRFTGHQVSAGAGAAMYTYGSFTGTNLLFVDNSSLNLGKGSALYVHLGSADLKHATIARSALGGGSAVEVNSGATLVMQNSIITRYDVGIRRLGSLSEDYNVFRLNTNNYDLASGSGAPGIHSFTAQNQLFINPNADDYHLLPTAEAIGAGTDLSVNADLDGIARIGRWDAGAYQFWANVFLPLIRR